MHPIIKKFRQYPYVEGVGDHIRAVPLDFLKQALIEVAESMVGEEREEIPAITVNNERDLQYSQDRNQRLGYNQAIQKQRQKLEELRNQLDL